MAKPIVSTLATLEGLATFLEELEAAGTARVQIAPDLRAKLQAACISTRVAIRQELNAGNRRFYAQGVR